MSWRYWISGKGYYDFNNYKIYKSYKEHTFEELKRFDFEQSFTGQFLKEGFETFSVSFDSSKPQFNIHKKEINPTINWFGTSVYEPDTYFVKNDKVLLMSLQGITTPYNPKYDELFNSSSIKYIKMYTKDNVIYEDWTGNLPSKEIVKEFLYV